jgi:hypothetical protein
MDSAELQLQLVLLPPGAADITEDMPLSKYQVLEMPATVTLYVYHQPKYSQLRYKLSGEQLYKSRPLREAWWLRGATLLRNNHMTCYEPFSNPVTASCGTSCQGRTPVQVMTFAAGLVVGQTGTTWLLLMPRICFGCIVSQ